MKTIKLRLTLDLDIDPQGVSTPELMSNLRGIVFDAAGNGMFTGASSATIEKYDYTVKKRHKKNIVCRQTGEFEVLVPNIDGDGVSEKVKGT